jgi:hypothetical protein
VRKKINEGLNNKFVHMIRKINLNPKVEGTEPRVFKDPRLQVHTRRNENWNKWFALCQIVQQ